MVSKTVLSATALFLAATAEAQGPITVGGGDLSDDQWSSVAESANVTSSVSFTGRDIAGSFPGSPQDGWELSIAVKDDVEVEGSDSLLTATTLSLSPPEDAEFGDNFEMCLHVFDIEAHSTSADFKPLNCDGLVIVQCSDDLRKNAANNFKDGCSDFSVGGSCLRDMPEGKGTSLAVNGDNADEVLGNSTFFRSADGSHAAGDFLTYDAAGAKARMVIAVFGPTGDSEEDAIATVQCIMPDSVQGESRTPGEEPVVEEEEESSASTLAGALGWALFATAGVFSFIS